MQPEDFWLTSDALLLLYSTSVCALWAEQKSCRRRPAIIHTVMKNVLPVPPILATFCGHKDKFSATAFLQAVPSYIAHPAKVGAVFIAL